MFARRFAITRIWTGDPGQKRQWVYHGAWRLGWHEHIKGREKLGSGIKWSILKNWSTTQLNWIYRALQTTTAVYKSAVHGAKQCLSGGDRPDIKSIDRWDREWLGKGRFCRRLMAWWWENFPQEWRRQAAINLTFWMESITSLGKCSYLPSSNSWVPMASWVVSKSTGP